MKTLRTESRVENVPAVLQFVAAELAALGCPAQTQAQIKLAVDELFANICFYAYDAGVGPVEITVDAEDQTAVVTVCDRGVPFDPLSAEAPDLSLSGEERPIGGLGIFLLREMMDDLCYAYRDGRNTLRLKKHF